MARLLLLDWERNSCQLAAADLTRQGVEVVATAVWRPEILLSPATAEQLGKQLREFLKTSGVPAAPVLACVGRDRVVLKEISFPQVSAQEEPALVRFQATKDLADSPEEVVLDYAALTDPDAPGERQALAVILRREILAGLQQVCRTAGLKLVGLVPRPFGMAGCLDLARLRGSTFPPPESPLQTVAVLLVGQRWAELNILQDAKLLFSRSLGVGPSLAIEVRRCLTVLAQGQSPRPAPRILYLIGNGELQAPALQETLGFPVQELSFLTEKEKAQVPEELRAALAGHLGLLQSWFQKKVPVNLASPREPAPVVNQGRRRRVLIGALAAMVLLVAWVFGQMQLSNQKKEIQDLAGDIEDVDLKFKRFAQDKLDLDALKQWDQGAIAWLDEFYDLAARFPKEKDFRLTRIHIEPIAKPNPKYPFTARMKIQGEMPPGKEYLVNRFIDSMRDPHLQARWERFKRRSGEKSAQVDFFIQVDLIGQPAKKYTTQLILPPRRDSYSAIGHDQSPVLAQGGQP